MLRVYACMCTQIDDINVLALLSEADAAAAAAKAKKDKKKKKAGAATVSSDAMADE